MKRILCLFWLVVVLGPPAIAQLLYQRVYGSAGDESWGYLTPVRSGGYLVVGTQQRLPTGPADEKLYLVRTNAQGDTLWTRRHKLPGFTGINVHGICENAAGQVLIAASGGDLNVGFLDQAMLVLLSPQGDTLWTRKTGGPTNDFYSSLLLGHDGNFVLTGTLNTFPQWLKVNAAGQVVAQTNIIYDAAETGGVGSLFKDNSGLGGYWVVNYKAVTGSARKFLHLTEAGVVDQTKPLYGSGYELIYAVAPLPNNGGYLMSVEGKLARFTSALDTVWTKDLRYSNGVVSGFASAQLVQPLSDGNCVLAGQFYDSGGYRVYLAKVSPAGQVLRDTVLFRGGGSETVRGLAVEPATGRYVFSGETAQGPRGGNDLFLGIHAPWRVLPARAPAHLYTAPLAAWPIPVASGHDALHLRAAQPLAGPLTLCDALGRQVRTWPAVRAATDAAGQEVSLAGVPAGLYLLHATDAAGRRYVARVLRE
ncbi:hypothetical protein F0P96_16925 [Hymenobacter busanensis]|uniref:Uncharacterized protein n=1 Tax=Hymenobacter busanensis TaxID=2607656 RepID=A0A7L4ZX33_9BACT|nr:hypothetical protein [Hymenobacter busanensis]KAA9327660.1 hypothetical protein F0P96_16925 [Hymenobacter busanensis]QHJ06000.1 hypothetical protein GUY19_01305 [Hymenobacter busanensis]